MMAQAVEDGRIITVDLPAVDAGAAVATGLQAGALSGLRRNGHDQHGRWPDGVRLSGEQT
jgi:hypothetical protein